MSIAPTGIFGSSGFTGELPSAPEGKGTSFNSLLRSIAGKTVGSSNASHAPDSALQARNAVSNRSDGSDATLKQDEVAGTDRLFASDPTFTSNTQLSAKVATKPDAGADYKASPSDDLIASENSDPAIINTSLIIPGLNQPAPTTGPSVSLASDAASGSSIAPLNAASLSEQSQKAGAPPERGNTEQAQSDTSTADDTSIGSSTAKVASVTIGAPQGTATSQAAMSALLAAGQVVSKAESLALTSQLPASLNSQTASRSAVARSSGQPAGEISGSGVSADSDAAVSTGTQTDPVGASGGSQSGSSDLTGGGQSGTDDFSDTLTALIADTPALELVADDADIAGDLIQQTTQAQTDNKTEALSQMPRTASSAHLAALVSQVSDKMLQRFDGKNSSFEIRLDPAELGKVDVRIEVDADGHVQAILAARDPAAADALMRGTKILENALMQAGLNLGEGGVQVELEQRGNTPFSARGDQTASAEGSDQKQTGEEATEDGPRILSETPFIQNWSRQRLDVRA